MTCSPQHALPVRKTNVALKIPEATNDAPPFAMPRQARSSTGNSTANIGFEAKLWLTADKLRTLTTLRDTLLPKLLSGEIYPTRS